MNKLHHFPTKPKPAPHVGPPKVTRQATPIDARYFVKPGERVPKHFGAYLPGIDPSTGRPWK